MSSPIVVRDSLEVVAAALVAPGKGILAVDESNATMDERLAGVGVAPGSENRRRSREMLLTAPGIQRFVSGVILCDETLRQSTANGTRFPDLLSERGIMPGIKVNTGAKPLARTDGETVSEGLDGLRERLAEYGELGARFANWRAVIRIAGDQPSVCCVAANAHALARYAALCQEAGIVPIVEPEVLMDGDHTIDRCEQVTTWVLSDVFSELRTQQVRLGGMVLKPNMVLAGDYCAIRANTDEVARRTLWMLRGTVPAAVPGVAFLSGGQHDALAAEHLSLVNRLGGAPWQLTFSYGRGLVADALRTWAGSDRNSQAAQRTFSHRVHCNAAARGGRYFAALENDRALAQTVAGLVADGDGSAVARSPGDTVST